MALTMVHLLVADRWAQDHPEYFDCPEYYLGAISPDAIHIRDHDDKSHKNEIHLDNWQRPNPDRIIEYWQRHRTAFDVGYGVHALTDGQWVPRYKQRLPGILNPDGRVNVAIYYNDTFVTDFRLYREEPRLERVLQMIESADVPTDHPLLTFHEFDQWRRDTAAFYRGKCPKDDPVRFIDVDYVRAFIADSLALIDDTFRRAGL